MDASKRRVLPERNPKTHAAHKREVFWQITLPLVVGILVLLAAVGAIIFSAIQPAADLDRWAGVSLMWLIVPTLFFALIFLVLLCAFVFLITLLLQRIPRYASLVQIYFELGKTKISQVTDLLVEPVLRTNSILEVLHRLGRLGRRPSNEV